jgi:hypothetical protein
MWSRVGKVRAEDGSSPSSCCLQSDMSPLWQGFSPPGTRGRRHRHPLLERLAGYLRKRCKAWRVWGSKARMMGLEPTTSGVTGRCSNQLSYIPKAYGISSYVDSPGPCVSRISTVLCRFIADSLPTLPLILIVTARVRCFKGSPRNRPACDDRMPARGLGIWQF